MNPLRQHIVAIRFSAMGDVAMCVPVIRLLLQQHPNLSISFVSDKKFAPLFSGIDNCHFIGADLKQQHRGLSGLFRLFREITRAGKIDAVADLHLVLRSEVIKFFFRVTGKKIVSIDKGRKEKKELTRKSNKQLHQLRTGFQRYADVFRKLGFDIQLNQSDLKYALLPIPERAKKYFNKRICIGIAPFAKHAGKMYDPDKMKAVVRSIRNDHVNILLFGGGEIEKNILSGWMEPTDDHLFNIAGEFNLQEELAIISNLKMMVSMDSANMHLASLFKVPVLSIWGPTHPFAGFLGWGQSEDNTISSAISCRPCSVYGDKPCYRGDHACMNEISPDQIISRIRFMLSNQI